MLCAMKLYFIVYQNSSDNSSLQSVILLVGLAYNANTYVMSQLPRILRLFLANISFSFWGPKWLLDKGGKCSVAFLGVRSFVSGVLHCLCPSLFSKPILLALSSQLPRSTQNFQIKGDRTLRHDQLKEQFQSTEWKGYDFIVMNTE